MNEELAQFLPAPVADAGVIWRDVALYVGVMSNERRKMSALYAACGK